MAKGAILKKEITDIILKTFKGSFLYNDGKEIRIPGVEDGQEVQIKVSLTCAKTNVGQGEDNATPGEINFGEEANKNATNTTHEQRAEPTQEEKDNVLKLMASLGL